MSGTVQPNRTVITEPPTVSVHTGQAVDTELTFYWCIDNIRDKMKNYNPGEIVDTGIFNIGDTQWRFRLFPNGITERFKNNMSLKLYNQNNRRISAKYKYFIGKTEKDGFHVWKQSGENACQVKEYQPGKGWGLDKFLKHEKLLEGTQSHLIANGRLELQMKITLLRKLISTINEVGSARDIATAEQVTMELSSDFENMLENKMFTDCQIVCDGELIHCHKAVLSARSDVFQAMFENNMKENQTGRVEINDVDGETTNYMIKYIYTAKVDPGVLERMGDKLLDVADKYNLAGLRELCVNSLMSSLVLENLLDRIVLADMHNAECLKEVAKKMIVENSAAVVKQKDWKKKLGRFPDLLIEVFEAVSSSK